MKVMIVDDSEIISKRLKELLQDIDGLEIAALVEDGIQAISQYSTVNPDIVILDLMIPRMNGLDVLRSIRSKGEPVIIIILTNYDQSYFRDRCAELGANYFLDKSADFEKVFQICNNIVYPRQINDTDYLLLTKKQS
ncbi:MAG: response regulator transcription factor [Ignavibacteriaceae bacterium]|jgi:DNA-binding NarL/FixJ family response regulator